MSSTNKWSSPARKKTPSKSAPDKDWSRLNHEAKERFGITRKASSDLFLLHLLKWLELIRACTAGRGQASYTQD